MAETPRNPKPKPRRFDVPEGLEVEFWVSIGDSPALFGPYSTYAKALEGGREKVRPGYWFNVEKRYRAPLPEAKS
jgi:hypothetical protein